MVFYVFFSFLGIHVLYNVLD